MHSIRLRVLALLAIVTLVAVAPGAAAAEDDELESLEEYWLEAYEGAGKRAANDLQSQSLELAGTDSFKGTLARKLLAKAKPDECFYGVGDPRNEYGAETCDEGTWKVNQAYVWGLTESRHTLWFGTGPNVHCLVVGGFLGQELPHQTDSWACEFGASNFSPPLPGAVGDWRPPQIFSFNTRTRKLIDRTPADPRIRTTLGIRSAGSIGRVAFLAGPDLQGGINVFAYDTKTGKYRGSVSLPEYDNIRKWLVVDGALYTAVGATAGGGRVLRWTGKFWKPFQFEEVGILGSEGAELERHDGRIFVTTWPEVTGAGDDPATMRERSASLWMSPLVPEGGLTEGHAGDWQQVWSALDYDPDPVTAMVYGGGALASFKGKLYWGTMHVPLLSAVANFTVYGMPADDRELLTAVLGTHRAISIFRGDDFGEPDQDIDLLYGMPAFPVFDPVAREWSIVPNVMGERPRFGPSGAWNFFNNYTWTMDVYQRNLYVGTMDWSYLFSDAVKTLAGQLGVALPEVDLRLPSHFYGADLLRFWSGRKPAVFESKNGVLNHTSYGIRTMVSSGRQLYLGMANPMNLLTDRSDKLPEGGWELVRLVKRR